MSSKELGAVFDPEIHGPGQMRFGFNGSRTLEITHPISVINRQLHESGVFPNSTPEDLPPPEVEFSAKLLRIIQGLDELGCIKPSGEFTNRSDEDGVVGKVVWTLMERMKVLVAPSAADDNNSPDADLLSFVRETPLVSAVITAVPPKGKSIV